VGTAVAVAPSVIVRDANGNPVPGVSVAFEVTSGDGSVTGASTTTNASGVATVGSWTLGVIAGANTLTATSAGLTGSPVTFRATGTAGAAMQYLVTVSDTAPIAGATITISAQLVDANGNAVELPGKTVTWTKSDTAGSFAAATSVTMDNGAATTTLTTTGAVGTVVTVTATDETGVRGTSVAIVPVVGPASQIASYAGGDQSAPVGTAVPVLPSVIVRDVNGNPVAGVEVTFAVVAGGGSITGASATTNASGIATVGSWTLGMTVGENTLTASSAGLTGSPVTFTASGRLGTTSRYRVTSSNLAPAAGTSVTITAQLLDSNGNAMATSGKTVIWTKNVSGGAFDVGASVTDAAGVATVLFTPSTVAGTITVAMATDDENLSGLSAPITTVAGAGTRYLVTVSEALPVVGSTVTVSAQLADGFGNPVTTIGQRVTWSQSATGGSFGSAVSNTDATGVATTEFTTPTVAGTTVSVTATTDDVTGSSASFTTVAGQATQIVADTRTGQAAFVGTAVETIPAVRVQDLYGNPIAGVAVTFTVVSGGGSVTGASSVTDARGMATVGSWTLGSTPGTNSLSATSVGLAGSPVTFTAMAESRVAKVSTGSGHSMILRADGTVWGMGHNLRGEVGDGTTDVRSAPVQVLAGVAAVSSGQGFTIALKSDSSVWAWGDNDFGQLGDGSTTTRLSPTAIGWIRVTSVSAGFGHSVLSRRQFAEHHATGDNSSGAFGDGTTTSRTTPSPVGTAFLGDFSTVSAGNGFTMILKADGSLWASGRNDRGQLGIGTTTSRTTAALVMTGVASVSAGYAHTMILKTDGTLWATGQNNNGGGGGKLGDGTLVDRSVPVQIMSGVAAVSAGGQHTMILKTDGTLWATGNNSDGQLGDGTTTSRATPVQVMSGVAAVAAGDTHTLILKADGTLWGTGRNNVGQLGDGTTTSRSTPVRIAPASMP
jgi:alpha-tubulin suppressor-like RCC1 family protein